MLSPVELYCRQRAMGANVQQAVQRACGAPSFVYIEA